MIQKHIDFVKSQIKYHTAQIERFSKSYNPKATSSFVSANQANTKRRLENHERILTQFSELLEYLENIPSEMQDAARNTGVVSSSYHLTPDDLEGLPPELLKELNISESDELELQIMRALRSAGGALTVDKILIQLYRDTGNIHERKALAAKLYRMTQKNLLQSVPDRRGLYELVETENGEEFELESENPPEGG
ncbi:MAG: hypothetical protein ABW144_19165 [Candidatus Thiodiazotropha sp.]